MIAVTNRNRRFVVSCVLLGLGLPLQGQITPKTPTSPSSTSLAGLTYEQAAWTEELANPPLDGQYTVLCYALAPVNSSSQPFILRPVPKIVDGAGNDIRVPRRIKGKITSEPLACNPTDSRHPLKMDVELVIAIDARQAPMPMVHALNINITTQQGQPLSPTPLRPSFGAGSSATNASAGLYFLTWPNRLAGDTIPTLAISAIYTPPLPADPWRPNTNYPAGSVVSASPANGHYYMTMDGGTSGSIGPTVPWVTSESTVSDNSCTWQFYGITAPSQSNPSAWLPGHAYLANNVVLNSRDQMFYQTSAPCTSNATPSAFPSARKVLNERKSPALTVDNHVTWQFTPDATVIGGCAAKSWTPSHQYAVGDVACDPETEDRVYTVVNVSGDALSAADSDKKPFSFPRHTTAPTWTDIGLYPPVPLGTAAPADQVVTLLNYQLPQVHSLYYYNLASGVLVTTIRSKTFAYSTPTSINNGTPVETGSSLVIDPVLTLTRYLWPFDAERKWRPRDLRPGISLSLSLVSPASDFYVGGSSEVLRYVQVEYGFAIAKVPYLTPGTYAASSSTMPTTSQAFAKGGYIGLSFNISGFIQGVFAGGK